MKNACKWSTEKTFYANTCTHCEDDRQILLPSSRRRYDFAHTQTADLNVSSIWLTFDEWANQEAPSRGGREPRRESLEEKDMEGSTANHWNPMKFINWQTQRKVSTWVGWHISRLRGLFGSRVVVDIHGNCRCWVHLLGWYKQQAEMKQIQHHRVRRGQRKRSSQGNQECQQWDAC